MKLEIRAAGRFKSGPERSLVDDYLARARLLGTGLHFTSLEEKEYDTRKYPDKNSQTAAMMRNLPDRAFCLALDEGGKNHPTSVFAEKLMSWRDQGIDHLIFFIGGADGLSEDILWKSQLRLAFGQQTWPHRFVRFMLAEQIYRALSLLAGTPYHRA